MSHLSRTTLLLLAATLLAAGPAFAETRPAQPKSPGVTQKGQDAPPKVQPSQTKPRTPPGKTKPFMTGGFGSDGTGI
ncbi:MAG: hypothetical protein FJX20_11845 [Alphaproteobacteria bacterium]|nr:hypothetical protein [Alphaproteobacteria bacterium]